MKDNKKLIRSIKLKKQCIESRIREIAANSRCDLIFNMSFLILDGKNIPLGANKWNISLDKSNFQQDMSIQYLFHYIPKKSQNIDFGCFLMTRSKETFQEYCMFIPVL